MAQQNNNSKSLESWIWDAACSIRGAKDAPKYKNFYIALNLAAKLKSRFMKVTGTNLEKTINK